MQNLVLSTRVYDTIFKSFYLLVTCNNNCCFDMTCLYLECDSEVKTYCHRLRWKWLRCNRRVVPRSAWRSSAWVPSPAAPRAPRRRLCASTRSYCTGLLSTIFRAHLSVTASRTVTMSPIRFSTSMWMTISESLGANLIEFPTKLPTTCSMRHLSPSNRSGTEGLVFSTWYYIVYIIMQQFKRYCLHTYIHK